MGAAAGAAGVQVWARFVADLRAQRARVARGSRVWPSPRFGPIEYAMFGRGVPVLLAHGAGGGFDQVAPAAERLAAAGYQVVAPSRFGYLRSSIPDDPTPHNQAEAFVALLDQLQLRQASVVGISAGALSALQLVLAYPERCRSLVLLVPAAAAAIGAMGVLPLRSPILMALAARVVRSDFLYWLALEIAPDAMTRSLLATDPAIVAAADPIERRRAWDLLWNVLPVSARAQGLLNDAHFVATPQPVPLDRIQTPTLVISLEDDRYRTIEPARSIAAAIPGARLLTYPSGGHVWVGHDAELMAEITAFLRDR